MCRIKRKNTDFNIIVDGKIINFKTEKALNLYIRTLKTKKYNIKEGVLNVRNKRLCS